MTGHFSFVVSEDSSPFMSLTLFLSSHHLSSLPLNRTYDTSGPLSNAPCAPTPEAWTYPPPLMPPFLFSRFKSTLTRFPAAAFSLQSPFYDPSYFARSSCPSPYLKKFAAQWSNLPTSPLTAALVSELFFRLGSLRAPLSFHFPQVSTLLFCPSHPLYYGKVLDSAIAFGRCSNTQI